MGAVDKIKAVVEEVVGKTREVVGKMTGNEVMEAEGKAEEVDAELKLHAEHERDRQEG